MFYLSTAGLVGYYGQHLSMIIERIHKKNKVDIRSIHMDKHIAKGLETDRIDKDRSIIEKKG